MRELRDDCHFPEQDAQSPGHAMKFIADALRSRERNFFAEVSLVDIATDAEIQTAGGVLDTIGVDINPWVFGFGVGRFEDFGGPGTGFSGEFSSGLTRSKRAMKGS